MRKLCFLRPVVWIIVPLVVVLVFWKLDLLAKWDSKSIPTSIRAHQMSVHTDTSHNSEKDWDKAKKLAPTKKVAKTGKRDTTFKTFGWYPYWMGTSYKNINYDLLWGISYFGYEVNPKNGAAASVHFWNTTSMVDSAYAHNCKVYLSLINLGAKPNHQLLSSQKATETLIEGAIKEVDNRKAQGLVVDFEGVSAKDTVAFTAFLVSLSKALKESDETRELILTLYAVDRNKVFDFAKIDQHIDYYVMMGYEYSYPGSKNASANAPLEGESFDLKKSVYAYLNQGVIRQKFILALPYYGNEWNVKSDAMGAEVVSFKGAPTYSEIVKQYDTSNALMDPTSISKYLSYKSGKKWRQVWYDDAETLTQKHQWIIEEQLAGIGIWALGYDHGETDLWKNLEKHYGK